MPILLIGPVHDGMLSVDDYLQIRLLHRDGLSIRQIAQRLGHGRDTIKKTLVQATPRPYTRSRPATCPKLNPVTGAIDQILKEDESAPRKQRHTAARIFRDWWRSRNMAGLRPGSPVCRLQAQAGA